MKTAKFLYPDSAIFVFARSREEQQFALQLGCDWAGAYSSQPPSLAHAVIDTTPAWMPILASLRVLNPGGRLVINAIRKETTDQHELATLDYSRHLWMEKQIQSVANITRSDVESFLKIASDIPIDPEVETYPFEKANQAIMDLRHKHIKGAKVLLVDRQQ
jgi:propanol-preferring alcohol dehydrogenase